MRLKIAALALGIVVVASAVGASAFTTASVDRTSTMDVVADDAGLIALSPGNASTDLVRTGSDGQLTIDFANSDASGVNGDSTFSIGDGTTSPPTYAFNVTNNGASSHDFTLGYAMATDPDSNADNLTFTVYDSTGTQVATATESSDTSPFTVSAGETHYVTVSVDTTGVDNSSDLSGTVTVNA
ncbi:hypothetical protein EFA46_011245 (plasmid) [Halarchaeum sp. CBA1220]|uniref:hypothetical protein n=1 Tax=Halarchaeum sp. CBA1220 TaxID=1853682 RepID=UPI000F3A9CF5|nr:hypothetical protein [Halarchaeum sp. CBA1220]QLC34831.1 hypothetical protein EFA46_011245 [Halarchaeum sp. CBA1220]